jgi:hypothetical protein
MVKRNEPEPDQYPRTKKFIMVWIIDLKFENRGAGR